MEIVQVKTSELVPYERNAKEHPQDQVEHIANSIKAFGFRNPIIAWKDGTIISGHGRLLASYKLGLEEVPVIYADDLTEEEANALRLADNKTAESSWDEFLLADELADLINFDMGRFGFDLFEEEPEAVDDEYKEEPPTETRVKSGDVWRLGNHRLICGDSTSIDTYKKLMDGETADIMFTSPPYNAGTTATETHMSKETKYNGNDDDKSEQEYLDFLNSFLRCCMDFSKFCFVNIQSIANNKTALIEFLYNNKDIYADTIIWDKTQAQPAMANNVLNSCFEYVHIFSEKANRAVGTIPFRGTIDNILHLPPQRKNEYAAIHNATFSIDFASHFVKNFADNSVLDPFGGTGTTLIVCEQLKKRCYMAELDPLYCEIIIDRWEKFTGNTAELIS